MHGPPARTLPGQGFRAGMNRMAKLALPHVPAALVLAVFVCMKPFLRWFYVFPQRMEAFAAQWGVAAGWVGVP